MPSIQSASKPVNTFPNLFVSPYGNDGIIPLYSSIPLRTQISEGCVPCVVCGNSNIRAQVIANEASRAKSMIDEPTKVQVF